MKIAAIYNLFNTSKKQGDARLYRFLKKHYVTDMQQLNNIIDQFPNSKRIVGALPFSWISGLEKKEIASVTNKIGHYIDVFTKKLAKEEVYYAKYSNNSDELLFSVLRNKKEKNILKILNAYLISCIENIFFLKKPEKQRYNNVMHFLEKKLSKILNKEVKVEHLGFGLYGRTFLLSVGGEKSVLKTFFPKEVIRFSNYNDDHGKGVEFARGLFAKRNAQKNLFAKLYMGKLTSSDAKDNGFMLLQYIDSEKTKPYVFKVHNNIFSKVYSEDARSIGNMIGKVIVDYGAIKINPELFSHKKMKMFRLIQKAMTTDDKKLFDNVFERFGKDKDFQEVLIYLKKALNEIYSAYYLKEKNNKIPLFLREIIEDDFDVKFFKKTEASLYMYEKIGLDSKILDALKMNKN